MYRKQQKIPSITLDFAINLIGTNPIAVCIFTLCKTYKVYALLTPIFFKCNCKVHR